MRHTPTSSTPENSREKRCVWCSLPKFGDDRCICDDPRFELMEACDDCGTWREVDHLHVDRDSDEERVICTGRCMP